MKVIWPAASPDSVYEPSDADVAAATSPPSVVYASTQAPTIGAAALPVTVPLIDAVGWTLGLAAAAFALRGATMTSATLATTMPGRPTFMNLPRIGVHGLIISPRSLNTKSKSDGPTDRLR